MKILFDIGHPAHVHLFRNFIKYLEKNNHSVEIAVRNKDIVINLLDHYGFKYHLYSNPGKNRLSMLFELLKRDFKIWNLHRKVKFEASFGTSVSLPHLTLFTGLKSYNFNEDDDEIVPLYANISYPFSTKIINPDCLNFKKWKNKRVLYSSYHELAYLHPNNFTPDLKILEKYQLKPKEYIVVRYSALTAHHDKGVQGLSGRIWEKVEDLIASYPLVISKENNKSHQIDPWDMHHILAFAKLVISDSQTMIVEAAVLGIPAIRYNSFVGRISCLEELEHQYGLTYGFLPNRDEEKMLSKIKELLLIENLAIIWAKKRAKMLKDKIDLNQWMIAYFEKEIAGNK